MEARYKAALERIANECGNVCDEYDTCEHEACLDSYKAWAIAKEALVEKEYRVTWEIDVTGSSPEEAVNQVYEDYFKKNHVATYFKVDDGETIVELEASDAN